MRADFDKRRVARLPGHPNLFVPCGTRLRRHKRGEPLLARLCDQRRTGRDPTLRRDAVVLSLARRRRARSTISIAVGTHAGATACTVAVARPRAGCRATRPCAATCRSHVARTGTGAHGCTARSTRPGTSLLAAATAAALRHRWHRQRRA
jgi:hypothetical protein